MGKLIVSMIIYLAVVLFNYSLFKIPIKKRDKSIFITALVLGSANYYLRFVVQAELYPLFVLIFFIILLMIFNKYPIFYAIAACGLGFICHVLIDIVVSTIAFQTGITTQQLIDTSFVHYLCINLFVAALLLLLAFVFRKMDIGFTFIIKRFRANNFLSTYNFIWAIILLLAITITQLVVIVGRPVSTIHYYVIAVVAVCFIILLAYTYKQNVKSLQLRYPGRD